MASKPFDHYSERHKRRLLNEIKNREDREDRVPNNDNLVEEEAPDENADQNIEIDDGEEELHNEVQEIEAALVDDMMVIEEHQENNEENNEDVPDAAAVDEVDEPRENIDSDEEVIEEIEEQLPAERNNDLNNGEDGGNRPEAAENNPLYLNATISVRESMLVVLSLLTRHNLTMVCVADIISAIMLHCPQNELQSYSLKKFKKECNIDKNENVTKHFYCPECMSEIENENENCAECDCTKKEYFIELPFTSQLTEMYLRNDFYNKLQTTHNRNREHRDNIQDVYDGTVYRSMINNGFLRNHNNITLSWYTDGAERFISSRINIWPFSFSINELPFTERKKQENMLIAGLWFGDKKPVFNLFLSKLYAQILELREGIDVLLPNGDVIRVQGVVIMGICDLPAKCDIFNFVQFNGKWGCPVCYSEGEVIPTGPNSYLQTYPWTPRIVERTSRNCIDLAEEVALIEGAPAYGVKGPSMISKIMPDFIGGTGTDRMHGLDAGTCLKLLNLTLSQQYSKLPFSLYIKIDEINRYLSSIRPPNFAHRMPRNVKLLKQWKSSELKMFLFYFSIPIFQVVMNQRYFEHFLRLVVATKILSQDAITEAEIIIADNLLNRFVREFDQLYGSQYSSINVHLLRHFASCVRRLGPLWAHTCYEYEDLNGKLLNLIHGTRCVDSQIVASHNRLIKMTRFIEQLPEGNIRNFCTKGRNQVQIIERIYPHTYSVGVYKRFQDIPDYILLSFRDIDIDISELYVRQYQRLLKNKKVYADEEYCRDLQHLACAAQYRHLDDFCFGYINRFLLVRRENGHVEHYAIIRDVVCDSSFQAVGDDNVTYSTDQFLFKCHIEEQYRAILVNTIVSPCFFYSINQQSFIAVPINTKELE